jgi:hypothetical protein
MTTLRQVEANRRNSLYSTGPRSPEAKEISRRNALKHGMAGAGVVLPEDEQEAVERRRVEWHSSLRPWNAAEEWIADQVVVASVQIDRIHHQERHLRTEAARNAEERWDDQRRLAAEVLGAGLAKDPARVALQLRQTPQGCAWMVARWAVLDYALKQTGRLDLKQLDQARDLLGIARDLRSAPTVLNPTNGEDPRAWVAGVIAAEVAGLREAKEALAGSDARERAAAALGLPAELPRPLSLLRRYEAACQRRMQWAWKQLRHGRAASPHVEPAPAPVAAVAPAPAPAPFDARLIPEEDEDLLEVMTMDAELAELERQFAAMAPDYLTATDPDPDPEPDLDPAPTSPSSAPDLLAGILHDPSPRAPAGGNRRARLAARSRQRARG